MNGIVQRIIAIFFLASGMLAVLGYAAILFFAGDRNEAAEEWGPLAGFAFFGVVIGALWLLATFRDKVDGATVRVPPIWLSFIFFIAVAAAGFGLDAADRVVYLGPLLTILGFVAVSAIFFRIASRWMPKRRLPLRSVLLPGAWGVFVAPIILMIVQGAAVVVLLVAVFTGIVADNPDFELDPNLGERISAYLEETSTDATSTELPEIVERSPTIALTLFSVVAIIAPLSEELVKAAGAILVLSRFPRVTRIDAFFAAVASSLGFAIFEGIGYTLGAGLAWHEMMLVRAPVIVMHVAATTIIVLGWLRMRETGRGFIPYFAAGTLLHAGWNALYVGFIYSLAGIDAGADPSAGQAMSIAAMVLLLGALFVIAVGWFASAAYKAGRSAVAAAPKQESDLAIRHASLSLAADGSTLE